MLLKLSKVAYHWAKKGITSFDAFMRQVRASRVAEPAELDALERDHRAELEAAFEEGRARSISEERFRNFRERVLPGEIKGAPPVARGGTPGHARSKHGVSNEDISKILNDPDRIFTGTNENGREIDVYYMEGSVAITVAGEKKSVITAYGLVSKRSGHPISPDRWASDERYVEICVRNENEVIFANRDRWTVGWL